MIEILLNDVTLAGDRRLRVVSDEYPVPYPVERGAVRRWSDDALGLHYLEATWTCREAIRIRCEGWKEARDCVLWKLQPGERVSEALKCAIGVFGAQFKCFPAYAFMKKTPKGIESGFEVDDVMLIEADWVPAGCIALCADPHPALPQMQRTHLGEENGDLNGSETMAM